MKKLSLTVFLALLLHHCSHSCVVEAGDGFFRTSGVHFMLNGSPYYANGFNAYWFMFVAADPSQRPKISAALSQAANYSLTVARAWAFSDGGSSPLQYSPGSYNEQMFQGLDFVISEARRYGVKLILSLANNYESYGGKQQYVNWGRSKGQHLTSDDDFFRNPVVKCFYKNHIRTVLNRFNIYTRVHYKDDPTIMAWELMNEPRCASDPSGGTIQAWIAEMASFVKSIDRNHLLEVGLEGFYGQSTPQKNPNPSLNIGTDFIANNKIQEIDFATVHSYPDQWELPLTPDGHSALSSSNAQDQLAFTNNWIGAHIQDAEYILRKPLLVGEFGKSYKVPGINSDVLFNTVYSKIYASAKTGGAAAGGLYWQLLAEGLDNFRNGYEIILSQTSPTTNVITEHSHELYLLREAFARMKNIRRGERGKSNGRGRNRGRHIGNRRK